MEMNFSLTILLQRTIELLAFYLILANIDGKSLKDSFVRLVVSKQRGLLYGNVVVLVVYPLVVMLMIENMPSSNHGYVIDTFLRPFIAYFLLRRAFNFKNALLVGVLSSASVLIVVMLNLLISLDVMAMYLLSLVIITGISYQKYFKLIYVYLSKKNWLLNSICFVSIMLYGVSSFISFSIFFGTLQFLLFLIVSIYLHHRNNLDLSTTIDLLENATADNLFQILTLLSSEHTESEVVNQYTIDGNNVNQIAPTVSKVLESQREMGTIRNYECTTTEWQIKINVIL